MPTSLPVTMTTARGPLVGTLCSVVGGLPGTVECDARHLWLQLL